MINQKPEIILKKINKNKDINPIIVEMTFKSNDGKFSSREIVKRIEMSKNPERLIKNLKKRGKIKSLYGLQTELKRRGYSIEV